MAKFEYLRGIEISASIILAFVLNKPKLKNESLASSFRYHLLLLFYALSYIFDHAYRCVHHPAPTLISADELFKDDYVFSRDKLVPITYPLVPIHLGNELYLVLDDFEARHELDFMTECRYLWLVPQDHGALLFQEV